MQHPQPVLEEEYHASYQQAHTAHDRVAEGCTEAYHEEVDSYLRGDPYRAFMLYGKEEVQEDGNNPYQDQYSVYADVYRLAAVKEGPHRGFNLFKYERVYVVWDGKPGTKSHHERK